MARSKSMGIGAMFVLLVVVIVLLPIVVRYIDRYTGAHFGMMDGFQDLQVQNVPGPAGQYSQGSLNKYTDANTNYICRSPNEGGTPCPEGSFCDGTDNTCKPVFIGGSVPSEGYYA